MHKRGYACRMVGFEVQNNEIIGGFTVQRFFEIFKPLARKTPVYGIEHRDFFVCKYIGIVSHSLGNDVLSLKKIYLRIRYAYKF